MIRRWRLIFGSLLLAAYTLGAQPVPGHYLVELSTPPLMEGAARLTAGQKMARAQQLRWERQRVMGQMEALGVDILGSVERVANLVSVRLPDTAVDRIRQLPGVRQVYRVYERYPSLDRVAELHRLPAAWQRAGGIEHGGLGQKIGIIDTGIDTRHPGLQDPSLAMPPGYPKFGTEADRADTTNKVIVVRNYDRFYNRPDTGSGRDLNGHGTAVAMTAAGVRTQAPLANVMGMAPKAYLGAYRVFPPGGGGARDDAILTAIDDAIADGMNVLNLSLGSSFSDANTDSLYARAFTRAAEAGMIVVAAVGNDGPAVGTIGSPGYLPEVIGVGATWNDRTFRTFVRFGELILTATPGSGPAPETPLIAPLADVLGVDPTGLACGPLPSQSLAGRIAVMDRGSCLFEEKLNFAAAAGAVGAIVLNHITGPNVVMATGSAQLPAVMISRADGVRLRQRLAQDGSTAAEVVFRPTPLPVEPRQVSNFSSRGPAINRVLKPDLAAVGSFVYTAALTTPGAEVSDPSGWVVISGTSFSAPAVAGIAAVLRQTRPGLTVEQYRSLIVNTATEFQTADGATVQPLLVGAGLANAEAATESLLASSRLNVSFRPAVGETDQVQQVEIMNLGPEPQTARLEVVSLGGLTPAVSTNTLEIPAGGRAPFTLRLSSTNVPPGTSQGVVVVTGTHTLRIPYWFASPTGEAARIESIGTSPRVLNAGEEARVFVRVVDTAGLPIRASALQVSAETPGLNILETTDVDALAAGVTQIRIRLPEQPGAIRISVAVGEVRETFSYVVR